MNHRSKWWVQQINRKNSLEPLNKMKKQIIAVIYFAATIVYTESRAEDSALQSTAKKYANKEKPFNNKKVITYRFVADFGESRTTTGKSNELKQ